MSDFNDQVIAEFRDNKGTVGGFFANAHVTLLHHKGRKSGRDMITPLIYLPVDGSYVLIGSAGGAKKVPEWFNNVAAADEVQIEVGEQTVTAKPTIVRQGPEWLRIYTMFADYWPDVHKYEENTDRRFPFARLDPVAMS
ncbi:nitroreductase family deazaflavin-dependent oxidoreductase [Kibdelosporangium philippinense]|uniref:Nitroreductase family deazaflavin-dependent oxidoreductase n=1 Tax=Kibdelosporangium philippinense TaxID=211113 RepID=A0ABS8Z901_9PSEU|nr:nitroreductase/quinone reductase family protein [Kibdelosporangium philippinense]MCE7004007.1 nitroreductase family deazaflavin-dependent oxidoreductase [Kibdelosporangium philippinense]